MKKNIFIRTFSIIAHIDHGKSTLADRLLEYCSAVEKRQMQNQLLDNLEIEKKRGITIKARTVTFNYFYNNIKYQLNLIDTPGHVDFNYEVSRSLTACEGTLLIVDATQGIQAQTVANINLALEKKINVIPIINKIDLPNINIKHLEIQIEKLVNIHRNKIVKISAKKGLNIKNVLDSIITEIPYPKGNINEPLYALIFDSEYNTYKGVIIYVKIINGYITSNMKIYISKNNIQYNVIEVGYLRVYNMESTSKLSAGEIGYIIANIKNINDIYIGDSITELKNKNEPKLLSNINKKIQSVVYVGIFPIENSQYSILRTTLEKLKLNDGSITFNPESSLALGLGFRCGFLGLLHMEIIQERIEKEYGIQIILTAPSVVYKLTYTNNKILYIDNPSQYPEKNKIKFIEEPIMNVTIFSPNNYIGNIMELCEKKRGIYANMIHSENNKVEILYKIPFNEIVYSFFDQLKSITNGYASFNYEFYGYEKSHLAKIDILLNGKINDTLSFITHISTAYHKSIKLVTKIKSLIPKQMFDIPIQASLNNKIIARDTVKALRKDVTSKCYGGDISRKRKLLEKQKEGKKRMKRIGSVEIPKEVFTTILKIDNE